MNKMMADGWHPVYEEDILYLEYYFNNEVIGFQLNNKYYLYSNVAEIFGIEWKNYSKQTIENFGKQFKLKTFL